MVNPFIFFFSHSKKKRMKPQAETSAAMVGWGWWSCAAFPRQRLCAGTWPLCTAATAARCRSDTKGQRVMNLFAPGSFFKCSDKSLFALKAERPGYCMNLILKWKLSVLSPPTHTHGQTCACLMAGAELVLSGPVHGTCNTQGHNHCPSNPPFPRIHYGCPQVLGKKPGLQNCLQVTRDCRQGQRSFHFLSHNCQVTVRA